MKSGHFPAGIEESLNRQKKKILQLDLHYKNASCGSLKMMRRMDWGWRGEQGQVWNAED